MYKVTEYTWGTDIEERMNKKEQVKRREVEIEDEVIIYSYV